MEIMFPYILFVFLLLFFHHNQAIDFDEGCFLKDGGGGGGNNNTNTILQVGFLIDRTKSIYAPYKKEIKALTVGFRKAIKTIYNDSRFAASFFADWEKTAGPATGKDEGKEAHTGVSACYGWHKSFNPDNSTFDIALEGAIPLDNGGKENTLAALAFSAADKEVGWIRKPVGKEKIKRVILIITDQEYYDTLKKPGNRTNFKGDGTDKCVKSKPPSISKVGEVLKKYEMSVIAVLLTTPKNGDLDLVNIYEDYFADMPGVPYCTIGLQLEDIPKLDYDHVMEDCFKKFENGGGGGGGGGHNDTKTILQLGFLIDRTKSFNEYKKETKSLSVGFRKASRAIYNDSRFAASFFADWEKSAGPATGKDEGKEPHTGVSACYGWHKSFNPDNSTVDIAIEGAIGLSNGGKENTLAALAFSAADTEVGWIRKPAAKEKVKRVIMLFTDQEYYDTLKNPGNRTDFKGDGTDKCVKSKPPSITKVGEVLMKYKISVIALLFTTPKNGDLDLVNIYEEYFSNMPGVPFCSVGLKVEDVPKLDYDHVLEDCFKKFDSGGGGGGKGNDGSDFGTQSGRMMQNDNQQCVFGDPPGFNTLGL